MQIQLSVMIVKQGSRFKKMSLAVVEEQMEACSRLPLIICEKKKTLVAEMQKFHITSVSLRQ